MQKKITEKDKTIKRAVNLLIKFESFVYRRHEYRDNETNEQESARFKGEEMTDKIIKTIKKI